MKPHGDVHAGLAFIEKEIVRQAFDKPLQYVLLLMVNAMRLNAPENPADDAVRPDVKGKPLMCWACDNWAYFLTVIEFDGIQYLYSVCTQCGEKENRGHYR